MFWIQLRSSHNIGHISKAPPVSSYYFVFYNCCPSEIYKPTDRESHLILAGETNIDCVFDRGDSIVTLWPHFTTKDLLFFFLGNGGGVGQEPNLYFCVGCPEVIVSSIRLSGKTSVSPSYRDYQEMVWLESMEITELLDWHSISFDINIVTTCRMTTLVPLVQAIQNSYYLGDTVDLHISVDAKPTERCLTYLYALEWPHGNFRIIRRIRPAGGAEIAVPEALGTDGKKNHYSILLEDDIMVSEQYYSWLRFISLQLSVRAQQKHEDIFFHKSVHPTRTRDRA